MTTIGTVPATDVTKPTRADVRPSIRLVAAVIGLMTAAAACGTTEDQDDAGTDSSQIAARAEQEGDGGTSSNDAGTDGDSDGQASDRGETDGEPVADGATAQEAVTAFSECMADQGIDVPDIEISPDGQLTLGDIMASVDTSDPATQTALLGCQGVLDGALGGQLTQLLEGQTIDDALALFSRCVRDEGYDVADLTVPALLAGAIGADVGADPRGESGSLAPLLAVAIGLDPQDVDALDAIDDCAVIVQQNLSELGLD